MFSLRIEDQETVLRHSLKEKRKKRQDSKQKESIVLQTQSSAPMQSSGQDVKSLHSTIQFYKMLKYRLGVQQDEESKGRYAFHKKYLSRLKGLFLTIYLFINPLLTTPNWCLNQRDRSFNPLIQCDGFGVPTSALPFLGPITIGLSDFCCLAFFIYFRWYKTTWEQT